MFEKLNVRRTVADGVNTERLPFKKLAEMPDTTLNVKGFFFTDGKYGKQVVVVTDHALVNMPKRAVSQFEQIENDDLMLQAVLNGGLEIVVEKEVVTRTGTTVKYTLQDSSLPF